MEFGEMKHGTLFFAFCILITTTIFSQTPSSAVWQLTANQSAVATGDVTAADQQLSNMQVTYSSSVQRSSPVGTAGSWPGESMQNNDRYMQFAVSPKVNFEFTVASVSLKLYVNSGSNMKANVYYSTDSTFAIKTQIGTTLSLSSSAPASPNVNASPNIVVATGHTFYLRIYPWYTDATTGKYVITNSVTISGTTVNNTAPIIFTSVSSLPEAGTVVAGETINGTTYSISASNLIADLVVKAPEHFKVSLDSSLYLDSLVIAPSGGVVAETPIYTRFAPTSAVGLIEDVITNSSTNAVAKNIEVSGVSLSTEPSQQSAISFGTITGTSAAVTISGGAGSRRIIVARKDSAVTFVPADGVEYSGADSNFTTAVNQAGGNKIVYDGSGSEIIVTGLSVASDYYFAVYEYNVGTGNSHNYLQSNPGTGKITTLAVAGLNASPAHIAFGNVVAGSTSKEKTLTLSGKFLTPPSGSVNIISSSIFNISTSSTTGYDTTLNTPYSSGTLDSITIYVRFAPAEKIHYDGTIQIFGGGADTITVSVTGDGVDQIIVPDSIPFGFASLGAGTTGGAGGTEIFLTSAQQLADIMLPREKSSNPQNPIILYITGTLSGYGDEIDIKRTKNVSIIGVGSDAKVQGFGFKMVESSNIIIRNITFADAKAGEKDAMSIEGCNNVWIDHCSFTDSPSIDISGSSHDGQLDIKKGSYNVTVSYNYFTNHRKTALFGHSVSEKGDTAMRVTYYRNWFDGTYSRNPRARYGKAHILNNLYTGVGIVGADQGGYAVGSTCAAHLLVEGNYFENVSRPTLISQVNDPGGTLSGDPAGYLKAVNNYSVSSGPIVENIGAFNFNPSDSYSYVPLDAEQVKDIVKATAGAGKMEGGVINSVTTSVSTSPRAFALYQNYPNPFNPSTTIQFSVEKEAMATVRVFNIIGQEVAVLFSNHAVPGKIYSVLFQASALPSAMYIAVLESGANREVRKMMLVK